jgi:hypothetical protein
MPNSSLHIGVATFHQMHILLTWNIRHIANAHVREDMRVLIASLGCTNGEVKLWDSGRHYTLVSYIVWTLTAAGCLEKAAAGCAQSTVLRTNLLVATLAGRTRPSSCSE